MSLYLVDSNAFSDLMRENPVITSRLGALSAEDRVVTCAAVPFGIERWCSLGSSGSPKVSASVTSNVKRPTYSQT